MSLPHDNASGASPLADGALSLTKEFVHRFWNGEIGFAFATLNLANGENIKTVSVLMGHASSAYTLDLYAGYVPNTELGIGTRYINYLRRAA